MRERTWNYLVVATSLLTAWFAVTLQFGVGAMDPGFPDWFMVPGADWTQHYFGWVYYRFAPWQWPPGTLTGYAYPMVSSMGYTDAIPLVAMPLKALSPWLPEPFQYIGWWLFTCFALQIGFGYRLLRALKTPFPYAWLGSIFFGLSPTLLFRDGHPALCAHWVLTALWWAYFSSQPKRNIRIATGIAALSAWIHPYLAAMAIAMYLAILVKNVWIDRSLSWLQGSALAIGLLAWTFLSFYLIGYFNLPATQQEGLGVGEFSANWNTWFNPHTESAFWKALPWAAPGQYEGYGYLGTALLVLIAMLILHRAIQSHGPWPSSRAEWLALVLGAGMFIFALSPQWTFFQHTLFHYNLQLSLFNTFRSTGRFIWPLYYLVMGWTLARASIWFSMYGWKGLAVLTVMLFIHLAEFVPKLPNPVVRHERYRSPLPHDSLWDSVYHLSEHIWIYPPYNTRIRDEGDEMPFLALGAQTHRPISEGGLARRDDRMAYAMMDTLTARIQGQGIFLPGDILIMSPEYYRNAGDRFIHQGTGYLIDDYLLYIPIGHPKAGEIRSLLSKSGILPLTGQQILLPEQIFAAYPGDYVLYAVKDEATEGMTQQSKAFFRDRGSWLGKIVFQSSYAGIWRDSTLLKESSAKLKPVTVDTIFSSTLIQMESAGMLSGNYVHLQINGQEWATQDRGLHVLVLNPEGNVVAQGYGDLYLSRYVLVQKVE